MLKWDEIESFMAVAHTGSMRKGAKTLKVHQSTLSRRIEALEERLHVQLFTRQQSGLVMTKAGQKLLTHATPVMKAWQDLHTHIDDITNKEQHILRITAPAEIVKHWILPHLDNFAAYHPELSLDIDTSEQKRDLMAGEADIAIRACDHVEGDDLIIRKLCDIPWGYFCSQKYANEHTIPTSIAELPRHNFIGFADNFASRLAAVHDQTPTSLSRHRVRVNSVQGMVSALRFHAGIGLLPVLTGRGEPDLVHCFTPDKCGYPCWLVTSPSAYKRDPVRNFMAFAGAHMHTKQ